MYKKTEFLSISQDSPVENVRKTLPQGDCEWKGAESVTNKLQYAAHEMAKQPHHLRSDIHVKTMAVIGCGDEETMKDHLIWLNTYGWLKGYYSQDK